jgi:alkylation response protein AidB-like acyl-CoA dehydrogenase
MDFEYNSEEQDLRDLFARFFGEQSPLELVRKVEPEGFDRDLWLMLSDLGVPALGDNGVDPPASVSHLCILLEQVGFNLAPAPIVESIVALRYLASLDKKTDGKVEALLPDLLQSLRSNEGIATLSLSDSLLMSEQLIPSGSVANYVVARRGDNAIVVSRSDGLLQQYLHVHGSAPIAKWSLNRGIVIVGELGPINDRALGEWQLLTAAALNGLARRALEIGVAYASERTAFGKPIGAFQGVAHPLAEHATALTGSDLLVRKAAWILDREAPNGSEFSRMAFAFAAELASRVTASVVHLHGGYGAALEYDIQLFHQRAKAWSNIAGRPSDQYVTVGKQLVKSEYALTNAGRV